MERQRHHADDPCAGWDLVQRDWSVRARDDQPRLAARLWRGILAALRRPAVS